MADATTAASSTRRSGHSAPILLLIIGFACLAFWLFASLLEIQASEAFLLHGTTVSFVPDWAILKQPADLVTGHLSTDMAKATLWGWGIELIYLVCIVGYEIAHEGIHNANKHLTGWFRTGMLVLISFDAYTNFQYGNLASGFWGQVGFALVTAFIVAFFGIIGLRLIEHAIADFGR